MALSRRPTLDRKGRRRPNLCVKVAAASVGESPMHIRGCGQAAGVHGCMHDTCKWGRFVGGPQGFAKLVRTGRWPSE